MNEEKYYKWLASLVNSDGRGDDYVYLLEQLHLTIFSEDTAVLIPNDSNRIVDGIGLRERYCQRYRVKNCDKLFENSCTVLELMVGLATRMEDQFGIKDRISWFWELIANLELTSFDDESYKERNSKSYESVEKILKKFLMRRYFKNGSGGLFPLLYPSEDQRKIEIWYQMNAYLNENY